MVETESLPPSKLEPFNFNLNSSKSKFSSLPTLFSLEECVISSKTNELHQTIEAEQIDPTSNEAILNCNDDNNETVNNDEIIEASPAYDAGTVNDADANEITNEDKYKNIPIIGTISANPDDWDHTFNPETNLKHPKIIGYYSVKVDERSGERTYVGDKSQLRYLALPRGVEDNRFPINLLRGYNDRIKWCRSPGDDMYVLEWLLRNACELEELKLSPKFIMYTRVLTTIISTLYESNADWIINAVKVRGSIVLNEVDSEKRKNFSVNQTDYQNKSAYGGYQLEKAITRRFDGKTRKIFPGGLRDSFHSIIYSEVGQHSLLYSSRMCCVANKSEMNQPIDRLKFLTVKTVPPLRLSSGVRYRFWQHRVLTMWSRAMLTGEEEIIWGYRDIDFRVKRIERKRIVDLPSPRCKWSPKVCFDFLENTLSDIENMITEELTPYRFYFDRESKSITCQRLDEPIQNFIPTWYINRQIPTN